MSYRKLMTKHDRFIYNDEHFTPDWVFEHIESIMGAAKTFERKKIISELNKIFGKWSPVYPLDKKNLYKLMANIMNDLDVEETDIQWYYYILMNVGFFMSTIMPASFNAKEMITPKEFLEKRDKLQSNFENKVIDDVTYEKELVTLGNELLEHMEKNKAKFATISASGTKGGGGDFGKMFLSVGLAYGANGAIGNTKGSFMGGVTMIEHSRDSVAGVMSQYAKAVSTAKPGEVIALISRLCGNIWLSATKDCGTKKYITYSIRDKQIARSMIGKTMDNGKLIDKFDESLIGKTIKVRSPFYCNSKDGVCNVCYNAQYVDNLGLLPKSNLGLIFSSTIAAPLTGLALKASHIGFSLDKTPTDFFKDVLVKGDKLPFVISKNKIVATKDLKVVIDSDEYKDIKENADHYILPTVIITTGVESYTINTGYALNVMKTNNVEEGRITEISYKKGDVIIYTKYKSSSTSLQLIKRIWNNSAKYLKTPSDRIIAIVDQLSSTTFMSVSNAEIMLLNTYLDYDEEKNLYKRSQFGKQLYTQDNAVNVVTAIKRLNRGLGEHTGYVLKGSVENLGLQYDEENNRSDFDKVIFHKYDK